jgi:hypothetical protein
MDLAQLLQGVMADYDDTWSSAIQRRRATASGAPESVAAPGEAVAPHQEPDGDEMDEETKRALIAALGGE